MLRPSPPFEVSKSTYLRKVLQTLFKFFTLRDIVQMKYSNRGGRTLSKT